MHLYTKNKKTSPVRSIGYIRLLLNMKFITLMLKYKHWHFNIMSMINFMLNWVEHKKFYNLQRWFSDAAAN